MSSSLFCACGRTKSISSYPVHKLSISFLEIPNEVNPILAKHPIIASYGGLPIPTNKIIINNNNLVNINKVKL